MNLITILIVSILLMIGVAGILSYLLEPLGDPELNTNYKGEK